MSNIDFVHLHNHTGYSIMDSALKIDDLVSRTKDLGMKAVAITDHGNMYGAINFYKACKKAGVKPILGLEAYVSPRANTMKEGKADSANYHLVLLAENNEGYQNLIKISSNACIEGFYYRARTDIHHLRQWHNGLICLSACLGGEVQTYIVRGDMDKAYETALMYDSIFGRGNYFLELQDHGIPEQKVVNEGLLEIHKKTGIPIVCTNDCHYMAPEDYDHHDVLMAMQAKVSIYDEKRKKYGSDQFYIKSADEMASLFPDCPDALINTVKIAERCEVNIEFGVNKLPKFEVPAQFSGADTYLRHLVLNGAKDRYGDQLNDVISERIDYELGVIHRMGYDDYFLIVHDFIREAHERGILVGPGRGSAAGSIVSYCLKITSLDPIKYDLMFERFLDPSRVSMPDIDIDWQYDRRHEIINYVIEKYGQNSVAQIITFGTLMAKSGIRGVGRALDLPLSFCDNIAKLIPAKIGITLEEALETSSELKKLFDTNEDAHRLITTTMRLEGLPSNTSTHAAGVLICGPEGLLSHIPLTLGETGICSQFAMKNLDELGMLKMDFLGLKNLTVINETIDGVKKNYGVDIDMYSLYNFEDLKPLSLLGEGKTAGLFQLESSGMTDFMRKLQPKCIEDVIAGISLYRPGPMDQIPAFLENMRNPESIQYSFEELEPILKPTYGIPVYQEQAMQIVIAIAGYQKSQSDSFRKAISKKNDVMMAAHKKYFMHGKEDDDLEIGLKGSIPGALKLGRDSKKATELYALLEEFGKYAFNKSHAAVYAAIAYVTAYLKYYYPTEFMAALINMNIKDKAKVMKYCNHAKELGIEIEPPSVNTSWGVCVPFADKKIAQSLSVKDTDAKSLDALVQEREANGKFLDMNDYFKRCQKNLNKKAFRALVSVGAFDEIDSNRKRYSENVDNIYKCFDKIKNARDRAERSGREPRITFNNVFNLDTLAPQTEDYPIKQRLALEREFAGLYLTGHPLDKYAYTINQVGAVNLSEFDYEIDDETHNIILASDIRNNTRINIVAVVSEIRKTQTKAKKEDMAILTLEDKTGVVTALLFPDAYAECKDILEEGEVYHMIGDAMIKPDERPAVSIRKITKIEEGIIDRVVIRAKDISGMYQVLPFMSKCKGHNPVYVCTDNLRILLTQKYWADIDSVKHFVKNQAVPNGLEIKIEKW